MAIGSQSVNAAFTYDACGRTLTDGVSKLNYQYNLLGALTAVADAGTLTPTTLSTYRHLADGTKYMTVSAGNNGALLYRGPLTFTIADVTATTPAISFLRAETGSTGAAIIASATGSGAEPYFYVTDQLGSVRTVVDSQGSVVERNDYYTYGKRHTTGRTYADLKNSPLLFSGKEDQGQALDLASGTTTPSDLRILDFGARHYDPIVPRWTTPDPLAEKYFPITPYAYCAGDPVNYWDPDGSERIPKAPRRYIGTSMYYIWRENDFITRNGHSSSYYLSYGYPNAVKFEMLEKTGLMSKNGQLWIKEVERNLQESLEVLFILFGNSASIIEESYLKQLAFQTHPIAYINKNGTIEFNDLSTTDILLIASTPKIKDMINKDGIKQIIDMFGYMFVAEGNNLLSKLKHLLGWFEPYLLQKIIYNICLQKMIDQCLDNELENDNNEDDSEIKQN